MITTFIRTAREIIDMEGVDEVSIRKVAKVTGYNSATMYLYFADVDELITLASMSYLENYCRTLAADIPKLQNAYEVYLHTWSVFCQYAFTYPQVFYRLFYRPHSKPLDTIVERYYDIYPRQLEHTSGPLREMLHAGDLESRNIEVLRPLIGEGIIERKDLDVINSMTVCYFRKLLEEHCQEQGALITGRQTKRLLDGIGFLLS